MNIKREYTHTHNQKQKENHTRKKSSKILHTEFDYLYVQYKIDNANYYDDDDYDDDRQCQLAEW